MSDAEAREHRPSLARRVLATPISDLVRGRITGPVPRAPRPAPDWLVALQALPPPARDLVETVTRRTRLWRRERGDVARELTAHFRDGLDAGATPDELVREFGDAARAARLIRRAKKRCRPLWWRAWMNTWRTAAVLLLALIGLYLILLVRYTLGEPRLTRNIAAELNAHLLAAPEPDRAWPLYRRAYLALGPRPDPIINLGSWPAIPEDDPAWADAEPYLDAQRAALALVREAAARPTFGRAITDASDPEIERHQALVRGAVPAPVLPTPASENPQLIGIALPPLALVRDLAQHLAADARLAARRGNGDLAAADIEALFGMARQLRPDPFLISQLVGMGMDTLGARELARHVERRPDLFEPRHLVRLAHAVGPPAPPINFAGERAAFDDLLQRLYTDNGDGDGRLVLSGAFTQPWTADPALVPAQTSGFLAGPFVSALAASRREVSDEYDRVLGALRTATEHRMALWTDDADLAANPDAYAGLYRYRYFPVTALVPPVHVVAAARERAEMVRGGAALAIALELHRREHGSYPESLAPLAPRLIPAIPQDSFGDGPLRYRLENGRPLIYSVGVDGDDDGGRPPPAKDGNSIAAKWMAPSELRANLADPARRDMYDGDWIIWPPVD